MLRLTLPFLVAALLGAGLCLAADPPDPFVSGEWMDADQVNARFEAERKTLAANVSAASALLSQTNLTWDRALIGPQLCGFSKSTWNGGAGLAALRAACVETCGVSRGHVCTAVEVGLLLQHRKIDGHDPMAWCLSGTAISVDHMLPSLPIVVADDCHGFQLDAAERTDTWRQGAVSTVNDQSCSLDLPVACCR